jgi:hypothetical protein
MPLIVRAVRSLFVQTKRNARVVAKVKLSKVAMKMLLAAMLVNTTHAALEDGVLAFDRVGVDRVCRLIAHVLVFFVVNRVVAGDANVIL